MVRTGCSLSGSCVAAILAQCFRVPLVRQLYWWWGIRPITRHSMRRLLLKKSCVVLVPGGVQVSSPGAQMIYVRLLPIKLQLSQQNPCVPCAISCAGMLCMARLDTVHDAQGYVPDVQRYHASLLQGPASVMLWCLCAWHTVAGGLSASICIAELQTCRQPAGLPCQSKWAACRVRC